MITSKMKTASQSNVLVGLHIRDINKKGSETISVDIPVQYIVRSRKCGEALTNAVLIANLRQCAMNSVLEKQPCIPTHLFARFELTEYQTKDRTILSTFDNTLAQALEAAVIINNDEGVILHVYCAFASKYSSSYNITETRKIAAVAGGRERKRLATNLTGWARNAKYPKVHYVPMQQDYARDPYANTPHPLRSWLNSFVVLVVPEGMDEKDYVRQKTDSFIQNVEIVVDYVIEGVIRTSEACCRYSANFRVDPQSQSADLRFRTEDEIQNEGVEILFGPTYKTSTSDWQVIFEFEGIRDSLEDGVVVDISDDADASIIRDVPSLSASSCSIASDDCVPRTMPNGEISPGDTQELINSIDGLIDSIEGGKLIDTLNEVQSMSSDHCSKPMKATSNESIASDDNRESVGSVDGVIVDSVNGVQSFSSDDCSEIKGKTENVKIGSDDKQGLIDLLEDGIMIDSLNADSTKLGNDTLDENLSYESDSSSYAAISVDDDDNSWTVLL